MWRLITTISWTIFSSTASLTRKLIRPFFIPIMIPSSIPVLSSYRFGPEFQYTMEIDPAILEWKIPKLVIQPFVENACLHGIEGTDQVGKLGITIRAMGKKLCCMVKDNGIGMAAEKLRRLWADIKAEEPREANIAIRNIYQRLSLYYGEEFNLVIDSAERQGTTITLIIPVGGDKNV